jgi:hypothetical protein
MSPWAWTVPRRACARSSSHWQSWAALAHDLGYADQAHLTRDFTATIGVPPSRYAAALLGCRALVGGDGAQVERRAAAFECLADRGQHLGRVFPDLLGQ